MALPFLLGLVIGGGAVYAYNNRDELTKQVKAKSKDLKVELKKGEKVLGRVSNSIKANAKKISDNLKNVVKEKSIKSSVKTSRKTAKTHKGVAKPNVAKSVEPTLLTDSTTN